MIGLHFMMCIGFFWMSLSVSMAEEIVPDTEYSGRIKIESSQNGTSFIMPAGWKGVWPSGEEFFMMQNQISGAIVWVSVEATTDQEVQTSMSQPIDLGDGILLSPTTSVKKHNGLFSGDYKVMGSDSLVNGLIQSKIGKGGLGITFIGLSTPEHEKGMKRKITAMMQSVTMTTVKKATSPQKSSRPLYNELVGRKLSYYFTRSGYTEEEYIWLCPNGRFVRSNQSGGFGGGASGAFSSENAGTWSVSGNINSGSLSFNYNDGSTSQRSIRFEGSKLFLNDSQFFRESVGCD